MKIKLQIVSLFTLGILSGFVIAIILAISFFIGVISWIWLLGLTVLFNFIFWLIGPYISDLIYKWFYKIDFYNYDELKAYPYMKFIKKVCDEHHIKIPKIGIIRDQNPTAFTYGSAPFNARMVLTEGLFKFLNENELESVIGHELGHIVNRDFIIMSIAATLLQVLYEIYVIFTRSRVRSASFTNYTMGKQGKKDSGGILIIIGLISYFFYWIGTYLVLFLSRTREYYADEFSAKKTGNPNLLCSSLIKIAYGIASVPDTDKTAHLLANTRAQGIFDFKAASEVGMIYLNSKQNKGLLEKALLFDLVNPWAWLMELSSTHPLIGKRIKRLSEMTKEPEFKFEDVMKQNYDRGKMWSNFLRDFVIGYSTNILFFVFIVGLILELFIMRSFIIFTLAGFIVLFILFSFIRVFYRFPSGDFKEADVLNCMADLYASPMRGKRVMLTGSAIGRGQAGYMFGEDMMFQDKTGIIYLDYESGIPIFGNFFFAWKKLENLLNKPASASGWFFRGATHHIELKEMTIGTEKLKSYAKFWSIFGVILLTLLIVVIAFFIFGSFIKLV